MAGDRAIDTRQEPNHSDDGCRVHRSCGAFVIEGHVAPRHRRIERSTRVGNAATRLAELIENLRPLGNSEILVAYAKNAGIAAGRDDRAGLDSGVVLLEDPALRTDRRGIEELEQGFGRRRPSCFVRRRCGPEYSDPRILLGIRIIDRTVIDELSTGDFDDDVPRPQTAVDAV